MISNATNNMIFDCEDSGSEFSMVERHNVVDLRKMLGGRHQYTPSLEVEELVVGERFYAHGFHIVREVACLGFGFLVHPCANVIFDPLIVAKIFGLSYDKDG